jgi:hypothetical protein
VLFLGPTTATCTSSYVVSSFIIDITFPSSLFHFIIVVGVGVGVPICVVEKVPTGLTFGEKKNKWLVAWSLP